MNGWVSGSCTRHTTLIWRPAFSPEPFPFREKYVIVKLEVGLKTFPSLSFILHSSIGYNVLSAAAAVTITGHRENLSLCETRLIHLNLTAYLCWVISPGTYTSFIEKHHPGDIYSPHLINKCTRWLSWLRHCVTSLKVAGSNPSGWKILLLHCGPGVDSASKRNYYQGYLMGCKGSRSVGLTTLPSSCAV